MSKRQSEQAVTGENAGKNAQLLSVDVYISVCEGGWEVEGVHAGS